MTADSATRAPKRSDTARRQTINAEIIGASLSDIGDSKMAALLATEATVEQFEEALAWASGESDVMGELEKRLGGAAALVYEILTSDDRYPEEEN